MANPQGRHQSSRRVTLCYGEQELGAAPGQRLLDAILESGFEHRHICGGRGFCTSCRIEVLGARDGLSEVSALERARLGRDAGRLRLACQAHLRGDVRVRVPAPVASRFSPYADEGAANGDGSAT